MRTKRKLPLPVAAMVVAVTPAIAITTGGVAHAAPASEPSTPADASPADPTCAEDGDGSAAADPAAPADDAAGTPVSECADPVDAADPADTPPDDAPPTSDGEGVSAPTTTVPTTTGPSTTVPPVEEAPVDELPSTTVPTTTVPSTTVPPAEAEPTTTVAPVEEAPVDEAPPTTVPQVEEAPPTTTVPPVEEAPPPTTVPPTTTTTTTTTTTVPQPALDAPAGAPTGAADRGEATEPVTPVVVPAPTTTVPPTTVPPVVDVPEVVPPTDTTDGPTEPETTPNLVASDYDGVYADGVPVGVALSATRWLESRGDYNAQAPGSSASGAYQVIDSTWNGYAGYDRAVEAPPAVQDQFAYENFVEILKRHGNDVSKIPITWYYPRALSQPELMDQIPAPWAGNVLTVREYQTIWMLKFYELLGEGAPVFLPTDVDPLIPSIAFPVLGPVSFVDDWHFPRDGGDRVHEGLDFIGYYSQPLRAAFDGEVVRIVSHNAGISGVSLEIRREDGLRAIYRHINNDTPGTRDNAAIHAFRIQTGVEVGTKVRAGQIIGFMGDTGNAVGVPHLHFELRLEDRTPFAPYPAVLQAQQREQCSVGIGPWSTEFESPTEQAEAFEALLELDVDEVADLPMSDLAELTDEQLGQLDGLTDEQRAVLDELADVDPPVPFEVQGPDGVSWQVGADGTVLANGIGALIAPTQGDCSVIPDEFTWYGTGGAGTPIDLLPPGWWGDEDESLRRGLDAQTAAALVARLGGGDAVVVRDLLAADAAQLAAEDAGFFRESVIVEADGTIRPVVPIIGAGDLDDVGFNDGQAIEFGFAGGF